MSDTPKTPGFSGIDSEGGRARSRLETESNAARAEGEHAREHVKADAKAFTDHARERAYEGADQAKEAVSSNLDDFAAAIRKASDELGERDQSMASQLVREVAGGLEQASRSIGGRDVGELTHSVAAFARERPGMFMAGMALAGLALGRFVQASGDHHAGSGRSHRQDDRFAGSARGDGWAGEPMPARTTPGPVAAATATPGRASSPTGYTPTSDSASRSTLASPEAPARARPSDLKTGD